MNVGSNDKSMDGALLPQVTIDNQDTMQGNDEFWHDKKKQEEYITKILA